MRIIFDMQCLQTGSSLRGIGKYSISLVSQLLQQYTEDNVFFLFNDSSFDKELTNQIDEFRKLHRDINILRFPLPGCNKLDLIYHADLLSMSQDIRNRLIQAVEPDIVYICSLVEFDAVVSVLPKSERSYIVSCILYDLIPLTDPDTYLPSKEIREYYDAQIGYYKNSDLLLAISEFTRRSAIKELGIGIDGIINISGASRLTQYNGLIDEENINSLKGKYGKYILYVGGYDKRKNVDKLVKCFGEVKKRTRDKYQLVLAGGISEIDRHDINQLALKNGVQDELYILGSMDDVTIASLMKAAYLFVFPSENEGLGLPPLEAMSLGLPTLVASSTSLTEVIDWKKCQFDQNDESEFIERVVLGLEDAEFREEMKEYARNRIKKFTWEATALKAFSSAHHCYDVSRTVHKLPMPFHDSFFECTLQKYDVNRSEYRSMMLDILNKAVHAFRDIKDKDISIPEELLITEAFNDAVPSFNSSNQPMVFGSVVCREQHFRMPLYQYWCRELNEEPKFHRKQWEFVYICQVLHERNYLRDGLDAIGFGVGKESLPSLFAKNGIKVLATDLDYDNAKDLGWVSTDQHAESIDVLNKDGICDESKFRKLVSFRNVNMNDFPEDIGSFDICWSACAFEHLGSIDKGLEFVKKSSRCLKPGGIAVHTTEFNLSSNIRTLDNNPGFVIFRKKDIERLQKELEYEGFIVESIDFKSGQDELERYVDLPPYLDEPHIRLLLAEEFISTSIGIIIRRPL